MALTAVTFLDRRAEGARAADVHAQAAMATVWDEWKEGEDREKRERFAAVRDRGLKAETNKDSIKDGPSSGFAGSDKSHMANRHSKWR